jgi:hypothetical protein
MFLPPILLDQLVLQLTAISIRLRRRDTGRSEITRLFQSPHQPPVKATLSSWSLVV